MDLIYKPGNSFPGDGVYPTNKTGRATTKSLITVKIAYGLQLIAKFNNVG